MPELQSVYISELRFWKGLVEDAGSVREKDRIYADFSHKQLQSSVQLLYAEKRISDVHFFPINQVLRCVESAVSLGITHFRLTGGEPLCYPNIEELLCKIKQIKGVDSVHLTTNGVLLKEKAAQLKQAGIDSINVSLDTPDEKEYRVLTGGGKLSNVLDGIRKAAELEIPVKINAVLREQTDVCALAAFAEQNHVTLRFIEMMPIGFGKILPVDPKSKVLETLQERYGRYERIMQRKRKADSGTPVLNT